MPDDTVWRFCSICKRPIALGTAYLRCSVSTCNQKRSGLHFCGVPCWDAHLPGARHREAWAEEATAPMTLDADESTPPRRAEPEPVRRVKVPSRRRDPNLPRDVLVVVSKLKAYVRAASDFNTSDGVIEVLSEKLRDLCDRAIERAEAAGRKTIMERDFE